MPTDPSAAAANAAATVPTVPTGGLTGPDLFVIVVYLAAMLGMGLAIARKQRTTEDFFVGGRRLPAWAVGISLFASLLSTITYLGMPGEMFRTGLAFLTRQLPIPLVLVVVWCLWIPFFMKLKVTSAYEYLDRRFTYPVRAVSAVFCLLLLFGWISVVVLTASGALVEIAQLNVSWFLGTNDPLNNFHDADMHLVIIGVGLFSVFYTTLGGIRAVVWTDVIQFLVLMVGALFTMGYIAWNTGSGLSDWVAHSGSIKRESVEWFSWDVQNRSTVFSISISMFFWYTCTHGANQVALQRYFTVGTIRAARTSYLVSALASMLIGVILAGVGISLAYFIKFEEHPLQAATQMRDAAAEIERLDARSAQLAEPIADGRPLSAARQTEIQAQIKKLRKTQKEALDTAQDSIFPQFIGHYMPPFLRGLVVAALFAAAMSTIDSGANSSSTILTVDFFRPLSRRKVTEEGELVRARALTAMMGVVVVLYTLGLYHVAKGTNIIDLCQKGFNCFLGPLGATFFLGMFTHRVTSRSLLPAFAIGEVVGILTSFSHDLFGIKFSTHLVIPSAWISTVVLALLFSVILRTRATDEQLRWTWTAVVRGGNGSDGSENPLAEPAADKEE